MNQEIHQLQERLTHHPLYQKLDSVENIRLFMSNHVYAVWDFMSLLKSLQREITCVEVPWRPSRYPSEVVRFINQIVLGEESDVDEQGNPTSHFELYLAAMQELGVSTVRILDFIRSPRTELLPEGPREFVRFTLDTAFNRAPWEVAAVFFFGREKLIPAMFESMLATLERENIHCPKLRYYLARHIEVDGHEHGPLSEKCLAALCAGDEARLKAALRLGVESLKWREWLWDRTLEQCLTGETRTSEQSQTLLYRPIELV